MSLYDACERHCVPHAGCLDCHAAKNSSTLRMVRLLRSGMLTEAEYQRLAEVWRRHANPDPADLPIELSDRMEGGTVTQVRTFSWQELVERLERDCAGDAT